MAKRKTVKRYVVGGKPDDSPDKNPGGVNADGGKGVSGGGKSTGSSGSSSAASTAASKAASDQSGGSRPSAASVAASKAFSEQSGGSRPSAASVAASKAFSEPSGGQAVRSVSSPGASSQPKGLGATASQGYDSVAQAAIAAKGLPGITEAGGRGRAPSPQGGELARAELLGKQDFAQTPMAVAPVYDPQRMMEINQTPGFGMPNMPVGAVAGMSADQLANILGLRAETAQILQQFPEADRLAYLGLPAPVPMQGPPAPAYDPQRMMEINQIPQMSDPVDLAMVRAAERAGLSDALERAAPEPGALAPTTSLRPTPAPQNPGMTTQPQMRPMMNPLPGEPPESYAARLTAASTMGVPLGYNEAYLPVPTLAPSTSPVPQPRDPTSEAYLRYEESLNPGLFGDVSAPTTYPFATRPQPNPLREDRTPPAPIPTAVPPGMDGGTTTTAAPATSVTPEQIAADTTDTAGFRTAAANIARVPGIGPTVAGVLERVGSAFGDGDGPFGLPANERFTIDDFTEAQREMDRGSDREQRGRDAIPFPGKGGGGRGGREQAPDNPPYIPPSIPAPVPQTPTPAYQSYNDLMAAAMMGYPIGMAGGGMVRPSMTNAFTPGSYYAAYDPFKRGIGGM